MIKKTHNSHLKTTCILIWDLSLKHLDWHRILVHLIAGHLIALFIMRASNFAKWLKSFSVFKLQLRSPSASSLSKILKPSSAHNLILKFVLIRPRAKESKITIMPRRPEHQFWDLSRNWSSRVSQI
jgi:hypothetical protein